METVQDLRKLNNTAIDAGLYNRSFMVANDKYDIVLQYLRKIDYVIDDIKHHTKNNVKNNVTLIIYVVFADWIRQSVDMLLECYNNDIIEKFKSWRKIYKNERYLRVLRSFIYAHPLDTSYYTGFDGTRKCIDIQPVEHSHLAKLIDNKYRWYFINDSRNLKNYNNEQVDYWISVYRESADDDFHIEYIGISLQSIIDIINDYIDYIYDLNDFLIDYGN